MENPVKIQFQNMDASPALEEHIREKVAGLEKYFDRITSVHVVVEAPHRHHYKGRLYEVRINIHVPQKELVVNHNGPQDQSHEDVYVAIRDAFHAAARKVEEYARKLRGEVKNHGENQK